MNIGQNIAKYRKLRRLTQEELGENLGVTNQAVSKWESGSSLPDVTLMPMIADTLGITLDELYGAGTGVHKDLNEKINEFPATAQNIIIDYLCRQMDIDAFKMFLNPKKDPETNSFTHIESGNTVGVVSYTAGGSAFISDDLTVISSDCDIKNGGRIFDDRGIVSGMRKLCDPNVVKVLSYMYSESFKEVPSDLSTLAAFLGDHDIFDGEFTLDSISAACGMSEDDVLDAVENLVSVHVAEISKESGRTCYIFKKTKGIEVAVLFKIVDRLIYEPFGWGCGYLFGNNNIPE